MLEFLPKEVREGLNAARDRELKRSKRLRVQIDNTVYPILRYWHDGFAVSADQATHLRGRVDIYDGDRHVFECLIMATTVENGELICEFKRSTPVVEKPALDFFRDENAPVGYLTKALNFLSRA